MPAYLLYTLNVCQLLWNLHFAVSLVFGIELGMESVDTVCDMSIRHVSHGRPMDVVRYACTPSQIEGNFHYHFIRFVVYT